MSRYNVSVGVVPAAAESGLVHVTMTEATARKLNFAIEEAPNAFHAANHDLMEIANRLDEEGLTSVSTVSDPEEEPETGGCGCGG